MPRSKQVYPISAALIEMAHDVGIGFTWPETEPVAAGTCNDLNLLLSTEQQPYQHCFGHELYPTLEAKAAYIFYHLTTGHIFHNGNKRTAVLCLDIFLQINSMLLVLSNAAVQKLAESVADARLRGERHNATLARIRRTLERNTIPISALRVVDVKSYRQAHRYKNGLRSLELNQVGFPLEQRGRT